MKSESSYSIFAAREVGPRESFLVHLVLVELGALTMLQELRFLSILFGVRLTLEALGIVRLFDLHNHYQKKFVKIVTLIVTLRRVGPLHQAQKMAKVKVLCYDAYDSMTY